MSYDLEVRSDDQYSRSESRERIVSFLQSLGARPTDPQGTFLLYNAPDEGQRIEIDLGYEGGGNGERVNFVGFGVPYPFLEASGTKVLELAFAVSSHLGWRMYDLQSGRYYDATEAAQLAASQASASAAFDRVTGPKSGSGRSFGDRVWDRLLRQTKFTIAVGILAFGSIGAYAGWQGNGRSRADPRGFVGLVLATAVAAVLLPPLLLALTDRDSGRARR